MGLHIVQFILGVFGGFFGCWNKDAEDKPVLFKFSFVFFFLINAG